MKETLELMLNRKINNVKPIPCQDKVVKYFPQLLPDGYTFKKDPMIGIDSSCEHGGTRWLVNAWYEVFSPEKERVVLWYYIEGDENEIKEAVFEVEDGW